MSVIKMQMSETLIEMLHTLREFYMNGNPSKKAIVW